MDVTETKSEGLRREYTLVVRASDLEAKTTEKLETVRADFQMKGFRKGKAPLPLLKKMFGKSVLGEVVQESVEGAVQQHLTDQGHRPAAQPDVKIANENYDEGQDLTVELSYDCLPEVPELDYAALTLERKTVEIDDASLQEGLERLAANSTDFEAREESAAAQLNDQVVIDFVGTVDGVEFEGGAGEDFPLVLGSGSFIPGFEDQLVGLAAGDTKDVEVTFPEAYGSAELAGKDAVFACTLKEVRAPKSASIDDTLAEKYGVTSLDELKEQMKTQIGMEFAEASRNLLKRRLLDQLDEMMDFELPISLVEAETMQIAQQLWHEEHPEEEGQGLDAVEPTEEHARLAQRRVRLGLLLAELGRAAEVEITEQELTQAIIRQAQQQYPGQEKEFFEFVTQNRPALESIRAPLFEDKVVNLILEKASVTEVTVAKEALQEEIEGLDAEA
ncbi:MAG: trigger factor [Pseudomonadota bacterium]